MELIKKVLRTLVFVLVLVLATFGAGIGGALMPTFRRQDSFIADIELVESREENADEDEEKK